MTTKGFLWIVIITWMLMHRRALRCEIYESYVHGCPMCWLTRICVGIAFFTLVLG